MNIRATGNRYLGELKGQRKLAELVSVLSDYPWEDSFADDDRGWLTCVLALKAAAEGNFGVGAVLTNHQDEIVVLDHNRMMHPAFKSELHAEGAVLKKFEEEHPRINRVGGYTLYVSLEPCAMCLARLINAGIGTVKYLADDPEEGMVHLLQRLPEGWLKKAKKQRFEKASCSPALVKISERIFNLNKDELNGKLMQRREI